jgi:hypothetical protein
MKFKEGDKVRIIGYYSSMNDKLYKDCNSGYTIPKFSKDAMANKTVFTIKYIKGNDDKYPYILKEYKDDYPMNEQELELVKITNWRERIC